MAGLDDLQKLLEKAAQVIPTKVPIIIEAEGLKAIKQNFKTQGFNDGSKRDWQKRKTTDKNGKDLTRYQTNRKGSAGSLTKFGRENHGRAILVGHDTGGDKLSNSYRSRRTRQAVIFCSYKKYAQRHNEGIDGMPKRQFMGKSATLENNIQKKLTKELDKVLNR